MLRIAVLIATCDKYSDVWSPLRQGIEKFLPDLRWPIFCMIERAPSTARMPDRWTGLTVPSGRAWSASVAAAVKQLGEFDYVLLWIDDLIPIGPSESGLFYAVADLLQTLRPNYLRLNPTPRPARISHSHGPLSVGVIERGDIYRASTILAVWRPSVLLRLLSETENAWQFEVAGSARSDAFSGFYGSTNITIPVCNLVVKGRADPRALRRIRTAGLNYEPLRPVMSRGLLVRRLMQEGRSALFTLVPRSYRRRLHTLLSAY
jgi:hypothetical protein